MKTVHTKKAPAAIGPYSQATESGRFVFTSGQIGIDPAAGKIVVSDIAGQAEQCCRNVEAILKKAGLSLEDVVKTTCYLANMSDFAAFNAVYAKYFTGKPARSCVAVAALPQGALCEIEVVASR